MHPARSKPLLRTAMILSCPQASKNTNFGFELDVVRHNVKEGILN